MLVGMQDAPRIFDCDNHYYEAPDAFIRHVPLEMQPRCVQWAEVGGRKRHVVAGKLDLSVGNPLFDPVGPAGSGGAAPVVTVAARATRASYSAAAGSGGPAESA